MIRIGLIGCGEHSEGSHAAPLARYAAEHPGEIALVAACDLDLGRAEQFCGEFGFERAHSDLNKMLSEESLDACVSVMPVERIVEVGTLLLERSIPCMIEKPLGASLPEVERFARVALESATPHMISVNRRFLPYVNRAIAWAAENGPLQYVRATMVRNRRSEPDFIWSTAIHAVDAMRHIAGEVEDYEVKFLRNEALSAMWYLITLQYSDGAIGQIEVLPTAGMVEESYELFGEGFRALVLADSGSQRSLQCWRGGMREVSMIADNEPEDVRNGGYSEVGRFIEALKTTTSLGPTIEDILPSARLCFSISEQLGAKSLG
jgi:myo-inositol 2-dehydrogenase / D-chiro-inositol 1-dehydrogenase